MFTGIIQESGEVISLQKRGNIKQLSIRTLLADKEDKIGDSICVNGVCLTVTASFDHTFRFDLSPETINTTTLGEMKVSKKVNIERALRLSDRLGGHLLSGHIDGIGSIQEQKKADNHYLMAVEFPPHLSCYLVEKGSIGIDGVSLTIAKLEKEILWVSIIPHTAQVTTLHMIKKGDRVNLEADLLAKYIYRFLTKNPAFSSVQPAAISSMNATALGKEFLAKHGFL